VTAQWQPIRKSILLMSRTQNSNDELSLVESRCWNPRPPSAEEEEQLNCAEAQALEVAVEDGFQYSDADAPHEVADDFEFFMPDFNVAS
jgi:hypothetical protein